MYVLTSSGNILEVQVRLQEPRKGDRSVSFNLNLALKTKLSNNVFEEQQMYLQRAAHASYVALNPLDRRNVFKGSIQIKSVNGDDFQFSKGSTSSGLGYALAIFTQCWSKQLKKKGNIHHPIFATGEVHNNGDIQPISFVEEKILSVLDFVESNEIYKFQVCLPLLNKHDLSEDTVSEIEKAGGELIFGQRLQDVLLQLLSDDYNGEALGRWQPFKGLDSFEYEDSLRFFGRSRDIERLYDDLTHNNGTLIVSGPTGAGKSSLIKAGLIPLLSKTSSDFYWHLVTPSSLQHPLSEIIYNFIVNNIQIKLSQERSKVLKDELMFREGQSFNELSSILGESTYLFYIDQFEEFFTHIENNANINDIALLQNISQNVPNIKVVFAIRNEYIAVLLETGLISSPVISNVSENLSSQSWHEIVREQAEFSNVQFENESEDLAQIIIDEAIKTNNALPMVEYTLSQLYRCAIEQNSIRTILSLNDYERLGGIKGIIATRAEEAIKESKASDSEIHLFLSLFVGVNNENIPYAKDVSLSNNDYPPELVEALIKNNILKYSDKNKTLKLAHDSLLANWKRISEWIKQQREFLEWLNRIEYDQKKWDVEAKSELLIQNKKLINEGLSFIHNKVLVNEKTINYVNNSSVSRIKKIQKSYLLFFFLPLFVIATVWIDSQSTRNEYYANYGERYGVPFGVGELSSQQILFKQFRYRMTFQGGYIAKYLGYGNKLIEMAHENSLGYTFTTDYQDFDAKAFWTFEFSESGKIENIKAFSQSGEFLERQNFIFNNSGASVYYVNSDNNYVASRVNSYDIESNPYKSDSIVRKDIAFDKFGFHIVEKYKRNGFGDKANDSSGVSERKFVFNTIGMVKEINEISYVQNFKKIKSKIFHTYTDNGLIFETDYSSTLNAKREKTRQFSIKKHSYDQFGNLLQETYLTHDRSKAINYDGTNKKTFHVNSNGWVKRVTEIDIDGNPNKKHQILGFDVVYDQYGYPSTITYLNKNFETTIHPDGYSSVVYVYDSKGKLLKEIYFDQNSKLAPVIGNFYTGIFYTGRNTDFIQKREYLNQLGEKITEKGQFSYDELTLDKDNYIETFSSYDHYENLVLNPFHGCAILKVVKSSKGLVIERTCHDINGALIEGTTFPAITLNKYNDDRFLLERKFLNRFQELTEHNEYGYAITRADFDDNGNELLFHMVDRNNQPALDKEHGIAGYTLSYDILGNKTSKLFVDQYLNPVIHPKEKVAGWKADFDSKSNETSFIFLNIDKKPIIYPSLGYAGSRSEYDDLGNHTLFMTLGIDEKPMLHPTDGVAGSRSEYDEQGNKTMFLNLGVDKKPLIHPKFGTGGWQAAYDDKGNQTLFMTLGIDQKPMLNPGDGVAGSRSEYDEQGNKTLFINLSVDEKPMLHPRFGVGGWQAAYDYQGNQTLFMNLGVDEKPIPHPSNGVAGSWSEYDEKGNKTMFMNIGVDKEPMIHPIEGVAGFRFKYDAQGNQTLFMTLGIDKEPMLDPKYEVAGYRSEYDDQGNKTLLMNIGVNKKPMLHPSDGVAGSRSKYDDKGNITMFLNLGLDEKPMSHPKVSTGGWQAAYDEKGNQTQFMYLGVDEKPMLHPADGVAGSRSEYDDQGNKTLLMNIGVNKKPMLHPSDGVAGSRSKYDDKGNITMFLNLGLDEKPMIHPEHGTAGWIASYNKSGNQLQIINIDVNSEPMTVPVYGHVGWNSTYNEQGNEITRNFFGLELEPIVIIDGYARWENVFDENGILQFTNYYGINGELIQKK